MIERLTRWLAVPVFVLGVAASADAEDLRIGRAEFRERVEGFWHGQLVGNYMGFPFENLYIDEPIPVLVDRYYTTENAGELRINGRDSRGNTSMFATAMDGAWSDDDTDIEFVTLHAVEKYGLDITHLEITEMWKRHINRRIWVANRTARNLMEEGLVAPATGSKENNENWFQIDPQLVNEIWSVFYPGMPQRSAERAEWGARITNDDWGTHPTVAYGVMISLAFFEKDPESLVRSALEFLPEDSPFTEGVRDVLRWHAEHENWREVRQLVHDKYYRYKKGDYEAPVSVVSSLNNGLVGVMALLYGEADFVRTVGLGVSAGYDCDNQAATLGGLLGVMHGSSVIPKELTHNLGPISWSKPFNDSYVNYARDEIAVHTPISEIIDRIVAVSEQAIFQQGGRIEGEGDEATYVIPGGR
ncbi:MAG: ADP-ribosylglycohydrolase family protein [Acidobacteriota bacterium]